MSRAPASFRSQDIERFWAKVARLGANECWLWQAGKVPGGYGAFRAGGKNYAAHRIAYWLSNEEWPALVRHRCDTPACCNSAHLLAGNSALNSRDRVARKRQARGETCGRSKLTWSAVHAIRESAESNRALARKYCVSDSLISLIRARSIWKEDTDARVEAA